MGNARYIWIQTLDTALIEICKEDKTMKYYSMLIFYLVQRVFNSVNKNSFLLNY